MHAKPFYFSHTESWLYRIIYHYDSQNGLIKLPVERSRKRLHAQTFQTTLHMTQMQSCWCNDHIDLVLTHFQQVALIHCSEKRVLVKALLFPGFHQCLSVETITFLRGRLRDSQHQNTWCNMIWWIQIHYTIATIWIYHDISLLCENNAPWHRRVLPGCISSCHRQLAWLLAWLTAWPNIPSKPNDFVCVNICELPRRALRSGLARHGTWAAVVALPMLDKRKRPFRCLQMAVWLARRTYKENWRNRIYGPNCHHHQ